MAKEVAELKAVFTADTSGFHSAVNEIHAGLDQSVSKMFNLRNLTIAGFGAMTAAGVEFTRQAIQAGVAWDASMINIRAATGRTSEEMSVLSDQMLEIGRQSREGPQAVAAAMYDVVSAVSDANAQMAILNAGVQLDEAGDATTQLASTVDGLINAMNAYQAEASEAAHFSDVYARSVQVGKGTLEEFVSAISPGLGLMSAMGVSFEEVGASIALFTTRGQTASQGMTKLEGVVNALIKPNAELVKIMDQMGVSSFKAEVESKGLRNTLIELYDALDGNEQALAKVLGTSEALQGAFLLMDDSAGGFFDTYMEGVDGATASQRQIQLEATAAKWDLLKSKISGVSIAVGSELTPALNSVLDVAGAGADFILDIFGGPTEEEMMLDIPDPHVEAKQVTIPVTTTVEFMSGDTAYGIWREQFADQMSWEAFRGQLDTAMSAAGITDYKYIPAGWGFELAIDGQTQIDFGLAMGDVNFTQQDIAMLTNRIEETDSFAQRVGQSTARLIERLNEIEGIEIDPSSVGASLGEFNTTFTGFIDGLNEIIEGLGIELPGLDKAFNDWWENSPLNPKGAINLIGELGDAFGQFTDIIGGGLEAIGLKEEEKGILPTAEAPIQFIADYSQYMSGDELLADYFGELTYPVLFQPAETVAPGEELFGPGAQIDFEEAQAALDAANLEAKVVMVPVDENGMPIGTLGDVGVTAEEAASIPIMIIPIDQDGNPIGGSIPEYFQTQTQEAGPAELFMAQTTAGPDFDSEQFAMMEDKIVDIRAAAEDPIVMDVAESSFEEIEKVRQQWAAAATDRTVKLRVNIEIGDGKEYVGIASSAVAGGGGGGFGSLFGVPGKAEGGPVEAGHPYLVGEQGPELIIPGTGGQVIPNDVLRGLASGNTTNFNGNFNFNGIQDIEAFYDALERVKRNRGI